MDTAIIGLALLIALWILKRRFLSAKCQNKSSGACGCSCGKKAGDEIVATPKRAKD